MVNERERIKKLRSDIKELTADLFEEREKWKEFKMEENMREFLLGREFDIANDEADLGSLRNLFRTVFKREPRNAYRCFKCNTALMDVHYAQEDRYPFEGWRGWCPMCKIHRDVMDPE
jgi:hypothetical protein